MVVQCPHCGGDVGEEACVGCQQVVPYYVCSGCKKQFKNPKFHSGIECPNCHGQVVENIHYASRKHVQFYVCQDCGTAIVKNPRFRGYTACANCQPPKCNECGYTLATNERLNYYLCVGCGRKTMKPKPSE